MDGRTSAAEGVGPQHLSTGRGADPAVRQRKPGRPPRPAVPEPDTAVLYLTSLEHFLPELPAWLAAVTDPRARPDLCTFSMKHLGLLALIVHGGQLGSLRRLDVNRRCQVFVENFRALLLATAGTELEAQATAELASFRVCSTDNLNVVLEQVEPLELERVAARCTRRLNDAKVLRHLKHDDQLVVAVDGLELHSYSERHCEHCLTRDLSDGRTQYYHYVLAAKVVTPIGLILPVAFEFVENPAGRFDKQDCEIKAFHRLARRIRKLFGKTRLLVVGDGLYAQEPVLEVCERYHWSYLITLRDGQLPTLQDEIARARAGRPVRNALGHYTVRATVGKAQTDSADGTTHTEIEWITPLRYHRQTLHLVCLTEVTQHTGKRYHNVWITDLKPTRQNAQALANTGRLRWKIENEGINTQKHGGYEAEHKYGIKGNTWKNHYLILQIAQVLNDLVRLGDLPAKLTGDLRSTFAAIYQSMQWFTTCLVESLRTHRLRPEAGPDPHAIQIRLLDAPLLPPLS